MEFPEGYPKFKDYFELGCEFNKQPFKKKQIKRANHVKKVIEITDKIVQQLPWREEKREIAIIAACLHDIKKLEFPKKHNKKGAKWVKKHGEFFENKGVQKAVKYAIRCHKGDFENYIRKKYISHPNMQIIKAVRCADKISHIEGKGKSKVLNSIKMTCDTFEEIYKKKSKNKRILNRNSSKIILEVYNEESRKVDEMIGEKYSKLYHEYN